MNIGAAIELQKSSGGGTECLYECACLCSCRQRCRAWLEHTEPVCASEADGETGTNKAF